LLPTDTWRGHGQTLIGDDAVWRVGRSDEHALLLDGSDKLRLIVASLRWREQKNTGKNDPHPHWKHSPLSLT